MTINGLWNRHCGPGGGTRRLHQFYGDEIDSTWCSKDELFVRYGTGVIGLNLIVGNFMRNSGIRAANRNRRIANSNRRNAAAALAA